MATKKGKLSLVKSTKVKLVKAEKLKMLKNQSNLNILLSALAIIVFILVVASV